MVEKKAVVILSGGMDSATVLAQALKWGYTVFPLHFRYGQRHAVETLQVRKLVDYYMEAEHGGKCNHLKEVELGFSAIGGSAITDSEINVPTEGVKPGIPVTYVPARNITFIAIAAGYAEVVGAHTVMLGVNQLDYSGYPDCRHEFIVAMEKALNAGMKLPKNIIAPIIRKTKKEIVEDAFELGVPLVLTWSCYSPISVTDEAKHEVTFKPCGQCDSCRLRAKGFEEARMADPLQIVEETLTPVEHNPTRGELEEKYDPAANFEAGFQEGFAKGKEELAIQLRQAEADKKLIEEQLKQCMDTTVLAAEGTSPKKKKKKSKPKKKPKSE